MSKVVIKRLIILTGSVVCILKLLTSGVVIGNVELGTFSGSDFALAIGALGALYWHQSKPITPPEDKDK